MIRLLDSWESYFATLNRQVPTHFVLAAAIQNAAEDDQWLQAFELLQERHILLRSAIRKDPQGRLAFVETPAAPIPVTFLPWANEADWRQCYAEQLRTAFEAEACPLIRVHVLRGGARTDLVITCHHSISDAMGIAYLIRDAINIVNGQTLPLQSAYVPAPIDSLWQERKPGLQPLDVPQPSPGPGRLPLQGTIPLPEVLTVSLSKDETSALQKRAREQSVSVHAAISAAIVLAGRQYCSGWREAPVRIATPVDLRSRLGLHDEFCLAITAFGHACEVTEDTNLWRLAVKMQEVLAASTTDAALLTATRALGALMQVEDDTDVLPRLVAFSPAYEVMISNLRVLNFVIASGTLRLETVLGPNTLQQFEGQQSIGVSTYGGQLSMIYASYNTLPGLLERTAELLRT
ncbi:MAG: phthiocerol/phthiodiolone dimycocerosyl transferase family protein [Janthinobacterium lividum]